MIVPVKKARVFVLEEHKDELVRALQKAELLMIIPAQSSSADVTEDNALLQRISKALTDLNRYGKKKSLFEHQEVTYERFMLEDKAQEGLLDSVETNIMALNAANTKIRKEKELLDMYYPFRDVDLKVKDLKQSSLVRYHIGYINEDNLESAIEYLNKNNVPFESLAKSDYGSALLLASYYEEDEAISNGITNYSFSEVELPDIDISLKDYIIDIENDLQIEQAKVTECQENLEVLAKSKNQLSLMYDRIQAKIDRKSITFGKTERSFYLDGWVRSDQVVLLEKTVADITKEFDIEFSEPAEADLPPTAVKNNKFISQFETITNMFSVPNHKEIDPNPAMAIWYWLIFGIMMGDIGYGILMLSLFGLGLFFIKPKGAFKKLISVFFYSGITSIIAGILFGSFFGANFDLGALIGSLFGQQWTSVLLNPVTDPLVMLGFSLVFGILHFINGLGF